MVVSRIAAAIVAATLLLSCVPARVLAQSSDSGEIRIVVSDHTTKTPLELARVILTGPVITSELTSRNGVVDFTDVPDGIYRARIVKGGYQSVLSQNFEIVNGNSVTVSVTLALSTQLKIIGTVSAKSTVAVSPTTITNDSAQRKLSNDLADALNKLSGVSVSTSSDDSDATQTISLEGHDPSQTQLTLDGIPLNAPGSAGNLRGFATDLFGSASVHQGAQTGALGGSVNFSTLQPTLSWMSQFSASTGTNGKYNYSFAESGSFGKFGIAMQTVDRLNPSLVDGELYEDASGLDYVHEGDSTISGDLVKLRYQMSDENTLTGTFLNSVRDTNLVCLRVTDDITCGYGPNNSSSGNVQLYSLADSALLGETTVQASLYSTDTQGLSDELNRYVAGIPDPTGFASNGLTHGYTLSATLPAKERHTISISAYGTWSSMETTPLVAEADPYYTSAQATSYSALTLTDSIHSNDKLALSESVGLSQATGSLGASLLGTLGASWRPDRADAYTGSYSVGGAAASAGRSTILSDPASLRFDCNAGVAYGSAPGDRPGPSSSTSARIGYTRGLPHGGNIALQLYAQSQNGVLLPTQVDGAALLADGTLDQSYIDQVNAIFQSSGGCGTSAPELSADKMYFSVPIGGVKRVYQGGELTGYMSFGGLVVQPYYNVTVAKAISQSPLFDTPYSITISGDQLPNTPLQKAGVVFDYKSPRSYLEYLADAQYTAKNNPNNLPAYVTFDAGVSAQLERGTLTLAASNITNAYGGIFSSPANALPYILENGMTLPTIARPLTPRSYSVTYSAKFGPGAMGSTQTGAAFREPRGMNGGYQGGEGGRGGFRNLLSPLPTSPPADPFALPPTATELCTADAAKQAQQLSQELKGVTSQIEAAKTASGYPATIALPAFDDMTVTYHGLGNTYALTVTPKLAPLAPQGSPAPRGGAGRGVRAFFGCLPVHIAQQADVETRKLYAPPSSVPFFALQIQFMPAVGLYLVQRPQQPAGQETFRMYALPSAPPKVPFEVRASAACTGDVKNTAKQALGELQAYFATGARAASWAIVAQQAKGGTWYSLTPGDPTIVGALLVCGRVAAGTAADVQAKGFDGAPVPSLNYAQPLGLYLLRPEPRVRPSASPSP